MHTDDHILQSFLGAKGPLPAIALDLGMTLIALVQWIDRNADLLAVAKRAMETHIAFLALRAEAAALIDLTQVSTSTTNEERKRKSASQLLRHSAKRLLTAVGAPPTSRNASPPSPHGGPPPSPRQVGGGEMSPSEARGLRGGANSPSVNPASLHNLVASGVPPVPTSSTTNPERELRAPCVPDPAATPVTLPATSSLDASMPLASLPSSPPNAECPMLNALSFSDHEIDVLMATLARHFKIDLTSDDAEKEPNTMASSVGGGPA